MSVFQVTAGILMTIVWRVIYPPERDKRPLITFLFLFALFVNSLFFKIKAMNLVFSLLLTATLSLIYAGFLFPGGSTLHHIESERAVQLRFRRYILFFAIGFMTLLCMHNFWDLTYLLNTSNRETVGALSPWGAFSAVVVILYLQVFQVKARAGKVVDSLLFRLCIFTSALGFSIILVLIFANILPGNTDKVALGIGGVGLASMSTNETSLLGCCLLIWVLQIQHIRGVTIKTLVCVFSLIIMVLLTQSRIGIGCVFLIILLYLFYTGKYRLKEIVFTAFLVALLAIPAMNVFLSRMAADEGIQTGIEGGEMVGSGRAFIWISYLDAFAEVASKKILTWFLGVGPVGVVTLYDNTLLSLFGLEVAQGTYFPLHSDLVFMFLATGAVGVIFWLGLVITVCFKIRFHGFNFCSVAAISVFVIYTIFDMLIYSIFSVWLLAMSISYSDNAMQIK